MCLVIRYKIMPKHYITDSMPDADYAAALTSFAAACNANKVALNLQPADLTEIGNAATAFSTGLNTAVNAKVAAKATINAKDTTRKTTRTTVGKWGKIFRSNLAVPDALLDTLMLPSHKTPGKKTQPSTPEKLVASATGNGFVTLQWSRNGNIATTTFVIEYRASLSDTWIQVGSTSKARWQYQAIAGSEIWFRVTANRRGLV